MANSNHKDRSEITMDYINTHDASGRSETEQSCSGKDGGNISVVPGKTENPNLNKHFDFKNSNYVCLTLDRTV